MLKPAKKPCTKKVTDTFQKSTILQFAFEVICIT